MSTSALLRSPPTWGSAAALVFVTSLAAFFVGRMTVQSPNTSRDVQGKASAQNAEQAAPTAQTDDESDDDQLQQFTDSREECKLILVVRTDLGMTKGKIAAQCSHATLACYKALLRQEPKNKKTPTILRRWEALGQAKIATQVKSEDELLILQAQAMSMGLCAKIIHDAGRTQIASGSATVLGIGPGPKSIINQVTGHLKLL